MEHESVTKEELAEYLESIDTECALNPTYWRLVCCRKKFPNVPKKKLMCLVLEWEQEKTGKEKLLAILENRDYYEDIPF